MAEINVNKATIAAGASYSVALNSDGNVWSWGENLYGQLGDGTTVDKNVPKQVSGLTEITEVSASWSHTVALKGDGTVWAWGRNNYGQLGEGTTNNKTMPVQAINLSGVISVNAGYNHSLALKADGTAWAWGRNWFGELGDGTEVDRKTPVKVSFISDFIALAAGSYHSLGLKSDGTVWAWGINSSGQLGNGTNDSKKVPVKVSGLTDIIAITAGHSHSIAVKSDGTVWAWGMNEDGQLGDGNTADMNLPLMVTGLTEITGVAAAFNNSMAVKADGTVYTWGRNQFGQLGDGSTISKSTPIQVPGLSGVTEIAAGYSHVLALKTDGTLWVWGRDQYGQLGVENVIDKTLAVHVPDLTEIAKVTGGGNHSLAIRTDGSVWSWGRNYDGQLGDGTRAYKALPANVPNLTEVIAVSAGKSFSVALKADGTVRAWGNNLSNQLGDGTDVVNSTVPVQVSNLTDATAIASGNGHSLALISDGRVRAWGLNSSGQLGIGNTFYRTTPVLVSNLTEVSAVAAGGSHSLALKTDGNVWAWGGNPFGQIGDGSKENNKTSPVQVSGLSGVVALAVGWNHSLALKSDGTVWTWGENRCGQLGIGNKIDKTTPVQVSGLTGITAVEASGNHNLALKADGTIWSWGENRHGELGDGTFTLRSAPVQVHGLTGIRALGAGCDHSLVINNEGTILSWGRNYKGQLGDGTAWRTEAIQTLFQAFSEILVTSVSLNETNLNLNKGETFKLLADVLPANATNQTVFWQSSNPNIAEVLISGTVIALSEGTATITATTECGGYTATCEVAVTNATKPVTGISLNKSSLELIAGDVEMLEATIAPADATNQNIIWSSSNPSVAKVTGYGFLCEVNAIEAGSAVITATTSCGGYTATCNITVTADTEGTLYVVSTDPEDEETGVRINKLIRVFFNVPIEAHTDFENIKLVNTETLEEIEIEKKVDAGRNLIINMASAHQRLDYDTTYEVIVPRDSVKCKHTGSVMASDYGFTFTTADSKKTVNNISVNSNYININNPNSAATIVPEINPPDATDFGLSWSLNGGTQPASGSYEIASSSGRELGELELLHRDDTTWGVFRPLNPGTGRINILADDGITDEIIVDVFFGYGIVIGKRHGVGDAVLIARHIVGLIELDRVQVKAANVNGDDKISVSDAVIVARYIVGLIDSFPVESD